MCLLTLSIPIGIIEKRQTDVRTESRRQRTAAVRRCFSYIIKQSGRKRNSRERTMDNRQAILDSALTLFYEKGYDAVGVQQIVEAAGVTKPTLYYYFGSKQGLLANVLKDHFATLEEQMIRLKEAPERIPEKLYHAARIFFNGASSEPRFYLLMLALFYSGRKSEGFQTVYPLIERYYRMFVELFESASQELGNMHGRQNQFAVGFSGMLNHYLMMAAKDMDDLSSLTITDQEVYGIVHQFMYGIYS